jgi:hypothetical protein
MALALSRFIGYSATLIDRNTEKREAYHFGDEVSRELLVAMFCAGDYEPLGVIQLLPIALRVFEIVEPDDEIVSTISLYASAVKKPLWYSECSDREICRGAFKELFDGIESEVQILLDQLILKYLPIDECGKATVGLGTLKMLSANFLSGTY